MHPPSDPKFVGPSGQNSAIGALSLAAEDATLEFSSGAFGADPPPPEVTPLKLNPF